ncbi:MAG: hypothetical protein K2W80_11340 [Burkholderiales bacterium]|nr:hypothetical protein [Burkholderiales bacterium]
MKFRGVGPALLFAFANHEVVEQSAVFRMRGPSKSTSDEKMTPQDVAAQAAQIQGIVARLREPSRSAVLLKYTAGQEKNAAYHVLGPYVDDDAVKGRAMLALANRSKNVTVGAVAQRLGVPVTDVEAALPRVARLLADWRADGEDQIGQVLRQRGLIHAD